MTWVPNSGDGSSRSSTRRPGVFCGATSAGPPWEPSVNPSGGAVARPCDGQPEASCSPRFAAPHHRGYTRARRRICRVESCAALPLETRDVQLHIADPCGSRLDLPIDADTRCAGRHPFAVCLCVRRASGRPRRSAG
jgi:hypothetical protein